MVGLTGRDGEAVTVPSSINECFDIQSPVYEAFHIWVYVPFCGVNMATCCLGLLCSCEKTTC